MTAAVASSVASTGSLLSSANSSGLPVGSRTASRSSTLPPGKVQPASATVAPATLTLRMLTEQVAQLGASTTLRLSVRNSHSSWSSVTTRLWTSSDPTSIEVTTPSGAILRMPFLYVATYSVPSVCASTSTISPSPTCIQAGSKVSHVHGWQVPDVHVRCPEHAKAPVQASVVTEGPPPPAPPLPLPAGGWLAEQATAAQATGKIDANDLTDTCHRSIHGTIHPTPARAHDLAPGVEIAGAGGAHDAGPVRARRDQLAP